MERLKAKYEEAEKALQTFHDILDEPYSVIVRDACIQRFEYSFEITWKFLKEYLKEKEGIVCGSPKSCVREAFSAGIIKEENVIPFLEMTDDRNMTSHTYKEEIAKLLYDKRKRYFSLMDKLLKSCHVEG